MAEVILLTLWYIAGITGFIYWYTTEFNLKEDDIPMMLMLGFIGPVAWIIGYLLHGRPNKGSSIVIKKRK